MPGRARRGRRLRLGPGGGGRQRRRPGVPHLADASRRRVPMRRDDDTGYSARTVALIAARAVDGPDGQCTPGCQL
jgi:hypothetical protein